MEALFILVPLAIVAAIVFRLAAGGMDHGRVRAYIESQGGTFIEANWAPFGPGWLGEKNHRIYVVRFLDRAGHEHEAYCKTSMWTGVYFTQDRIIHHAGHPPAAQESLAEENRKLRAELDRLKRDRGSDAIQEP